MMSKIQANYDTCTSCVNKCILVKQWGASIRDGVFNRGILPPLAFQIMLVR